MRRPLSCINLDGIRHNTILNLFIYSIEISFVTFAEGKPNQAFHFNHGSLYSQQDIHKSTDFPPFGHDKSATRMSDALYIISCWLFPFFLQNGILHGILVKRCAVRVLDKGHKLYEQAFPTHTQLFA